MTALKRWKEHLRVRIIKPIDNRVWRFWQGSEPYCLHQRTDFDGIARYHPQLDLDRLRTTERAVHDYVLHRFTAYAYDFERPLCVEPRMGSLVRTPFA